MALPPVRVGCIIFTGNGKYNIYVLKVKSMGGFGSAPFSHTYRIKPCLPLAGFRSGP